MKFDFLEQVNVDFEGFDASDSDFHGIKRLLRQSFRGLEVDISGIADTIISQNYVGSVIKVLDFFFFFFFFFLNVSWLNFSLSVIFDLILTLGFKYYLIFVE